MPGQALDANPLTGPRTLLLWKVVPAGALTAFGFYSGIWWPAYLAAVLTAIHLALETLDWVVDWLPRFRKKLRRLTK